MQDNKSVEYWALLLMSLINHQRRPSFILATRYLVVGILLYSSVGFVPTSAEYMDKTLEESVVISENCPFNITTRPHASSNPLCRCTALNEIYCQDLETVPKFHAHDGRIIEGLYMTRQAIQGLTQGAFASVNVRKISLNFNPIRDVISESAFSGVGHHLRELQMGRCQIQTLPQGLLTGLDQLTRLHLWGNQIQRIPPAFFKNVRNLTELLLSGNRITEVMHSAILIDQSNMQLQMC